MNAIEKAATAKRLSENRDFQDVMAWVHADIFATFQQTSIGESEKLADVHALSHGFKLLERRIAKYIELAKFEAEIEAANEEFH